MESRELGKSSSGLDPNLAGALAYLVGLVSGIIFLLIERENKFIRFHAVQSILFCATWIILTVALSVLTMIPILGWLIGALGYLIIGLGGLVLWILLMVKAFQGERYLLPILGEMASRQVEKG